MGCDFFLGMVAAVVVEVELLLLKLLMILFLLLLLLLLMLLLGPVVALLAWAQAPSPRPPPSRCSPRWASSVHDAVSVGMFVQILFGQLNQLLLLQLPPLGLCAKAEAATRGGLS